MNPDQIMEAIRRTNQDGQMLAEARDRQGGGTFYKGPRLWAHGGFIDPSTLVFDTFPRVEVQPYQESFWHGSMRCETPSLQSIPRSPTGRLSRPRPDFQWLSISPRRVTNATIQAMAAIVLMDYGKLEEKFFASALGTPYGDLHVTLDEATRDRPSEQARVKIEAKLRKLEAQLSRARLQKQKHQIHALEELIRALRIQLS